MNFDLQLNFFKWIYKKFFFPKVTILSKSQLSLPNFPFINSPSQLLSHPLEPATKLIHCGSHKAFVCFPRFLSERFERWKFIYHAEQKVSLFSWNLYGASFIHVCGFMFLFSVHYQWKALNLKKKLRRSILTLSCFFFRESRTFLTSSRRFRVPHVAMKWKWVTNRSFERCKHLRTWEEADDIEFGKILFFLCFWVARRVLSEIFAGGLGLN